MINDLNDLFSKKVIKEKNEYLNSIQVEFRIFLSFCKQFNEIKVAFCCKSPPKKKLYVF